MKVFVTGGTGYLGGHLVPKLLARGDAVSVLARNPRSTAAQSLETAGAILAQGDVTERESMRDAMAGAEAVYHVAGWYRIGARDRSVSYAINVEGTRNTLGLAAELGVPRIIYITTTNVFGSSGGKIGDAVLPERDTFMSEYDRTKYLAHKVADEFLAQGAPVIFCGPSLVYGPDDPSPQGTMIRLALRRRLPMLPGKRSGGMFAHVEDVADGLMAAADKGRPGPVYVLGGDPVTYEEILAFVGEVSGVSMPITTGTWPIPIMKIVMGAVSAVVPVPEHFHPETFANLDDITFWRSQENSVRDLGFTYRPYQEGLREVILYEMHKLGLKPKG